MPWAPLALSRVFLEDFRRGNHAFFSSLEGHLFTAFGPEKIRRVGSPGSAWYTRVEIDPEGRGLLWSGRRYGHDAFFLTDPSSKVIAVLPASYAVAYLTVKLLGPRLGSKDLVGYLMGFLGGDRRTIEAALPKPRPTTEPYTLKPLEEDYFERFGIRVLPPREVGEQLNELVASIRPSGPREPAVLDHSESEGYESDDSD
jgi:hypothetical protein